MNTVLTLDEINDALANTRTRGEYKPVIAKWLESAELALDLTDVWPTKKAASLKGAIKLNLDKNFAQNDVRVLLVGPEGTQHVVLVNMQVYAAQAAEAAESTTE